MQMIVKYVRIENYRNFQNFEVSLSKLSIIIGENDSGKSNFLHALKLPFYTNELEYRSKMLFPLDFNATAVKLFYDAVNSGISDEELSKRIPIIKITLRFGDIGNDHYCKAIVGNWLTEIENTPEYEIQYVFRPKSGSDVIEYAKKLVVSKNQLGGRVALLIPSELYDYSIISTNNSKAIPYADLKHITLNSINADRDDFSESNSMKSNSLLTKLLEKKLNIEEKTKIYEAYSNFFKEIKEQDNFKKVFLKDPEFPALDRFVNDIDCIPNLANLKNILSNITLAYGDEFLYQKGLGQRNIIFILLFFQHFKGSSSCFNLSCIEEPESHLSSNNLNFIIDYVSKSVKSSGKLFQTVISTHAPRVINKLEIKNVIAFCGDKAIPFHEVDDELVKYLSKRPNFDILKLLFTNRVVLVEGTTEEMLINTILNLENDLSNIDVISIGHKGFKTFLDIWKKLNDGNASKKIGVVRDYDNQPKAKSDHDAYNSTNIFVQTTQGYTLEDDIVACGNNCAAIATLFGINSDIKEVSDFLKSSKADNMLQLCFAMQDKKISIAIPQHITQVLDNLK